MAESQFFASARRASVMLLLSGLLRIVVIHKHKSIPILRGLQQSEQTHVMGHQPDWNEVVKRRFQGLRYGLGAAPGFVEELVKQLLHHFILRFVIPGDDEDAVVATRALGVSPFKAVFGILDRS